MSRSHALSITAALALAAAPAIASADSGNDASHGHHGHHPAVRHHVAGTVSSFVDDVLTITLADESTRSGKVTARTRFVCPGATAAARLARHGADDASAGDTSSDSSSNDANRTPGGDDSSDTADDQTSQVGDDDTPSHDTGDDQGQDDTPSHDTAGDQAQSHNHDGSAARGSHCDSSALIRGARVRHAYLAGSGDTAVWRKVVIAAR